MECNTQAAQSNALPFRTTTTTKRGPGRPATRCWKAVVENVLDFAIEIFAANGTGIGACNPDPSGRRRLNSFKAIEYQADLDRAITYALRDEPHLEEALNQLIREKINPLDVSGSEFLTPGLRSAVVQRLGPIFRSRKLEPRDYFRVIRQRKVSA